jgi:uncharacterized protein (DUF169 family)
MATMQLNTDYSLLAKRLAQALHLQRVPVAISFAESIPEGTAAHPGRVPAGCRFWEDAAAGAFATSAAQHRLCSIGVYTHNLQPSPTQENDLIDALKIFGDLGYVRVEDLPLIPVLERRPNFVVYAPLAASPLPPDIVLLFVDANQTLVLAEATHQVETQNAPAMGRPACAVVPQVMNTGRAALSLGCCGARAYLDGLDGSTAIFAIPGAKLEAYIQRIEALSRANLLLTKFHQLRRQDVHAGNNPTIQESFQALAGS